MKADRVQTGVSRMVYVGVGFLGLFIAYELFK